MIRSKVKGKPAEAKKTSSQMIEYRCHAHDIYHDNSRYISCTYLFKDLVVDILCGYGAANPGHP